MCIGPDPKEDQARHPRAPLQGGRAELSCCY